MANRVSIGVRTSGVTNGTPALEIFADAKKPLRILWMDVSIFAATLTPIGLGRPAAKGTPTNPVNFMNEFTRENGASPLSNAQVAMTWSAAPTSPVQFYRRATIQALAGMAMPYPWEFWPFLRDAPIGGLVIPANDSLVLWNTGAVAGSVMDVNVIAEE